MKRYERITKKKKYNKIFEAIGRGGQKFLWDDPEFQWEDVPFSMDKYEDIYEDLEKYFESIAKSETEMLESDEYFENIVEGGILVDYVRDLQKFMYYINGSLEDYDEDLVQNAVVSYLENEKINYKIEDAGYMGFTKPDINGVTVFAMNNSEEEIQIDLNLNEKIKTRHGSFTLFDILRPISEDALYELFDVLDENGLYVPEREKMDVLKSVELMQKGKKIKYITFMVYGQMDGKRAVVPEKEILNYMKKKNMI